MWSGSGGDDNRSSIAIPQYGDLAHEEVSAAVLTLFNELKRLGTSEHFNRFGRERKFDAHSYRRSPRHPVIVEVEADTLELETATEKHGYSQR